MASEGTLDSLRGQILEDKVLRMLLEKATGGGAEDEATRDEPSAEAEAEAADAPADEAADDEVEST
jgi:hypothetical protein